MKPELDVVVAGAGPAGLAAAAYAALAGMRVLVCDPHHGNIDKACGEGIMPGGVEALAELGVRPRGRRFVGIGYADALDPRLRAIGNFPSGHGLGVRRTILQPALRARASELGVGFAQERVQSFEQRGDAVVVNGTLAARWLIGADGLHSRIRRQLGVERTPRAPPRIGVRKHYALAPWSNRVEVFFGESAEAYVTPVDDDLVGVAFLFERTQHVEFETLLEGFPHLCARLSGAAEASVLRGAGPFEQRVSQRAVGRVLLVGDAAGYVDPLTGDGIAIGMATARAAVASVLEDAPDSYEARYLRITRRYAFITTLLVAVARRRRLHRPLLLAARAMPRVFDRSLDAIGHLPILGHDLLAN